MMMMMNNDNNSNRPFHHDIASFNRRSKLLSLLVRG